MEFIVSMVEIPVWIISSGYMREYGLIGHPELHLIPKGGQVKTHLKIRTINVKVILSKHFRTLINGVSRTVEYTTQHVLGHR